ncbi:phosphatase [Campylobacterota bacterium]|nr:phosphatase [Campylobacterota bacterium]
MKLRIISDLHVDENTDHRLFNWKDRDILTLIAGDTAGEMDIAVSFVRKHFNNAIVIGGNHIVYEEKSKSIQQIHREYREQFPLDSSITYLENDYKIIDDIVFIGATLWTDYAYKWAVEDNIKDAINLMDFHKSCCYESANGKVVLLQPEHCLQMFRESLAFIKKTHDHFAQSGKKMVLITHHGVSPQALAPRYKNDDLNASFISDLESYITTHLPQLNLIVHGHIHHRCKYEIGHIRVECNPCGYIDLHEGWRKHSRNKDLIVEI